MRTIACLGSGKGTPGESIYDKMQEVGRLLGMVNTTVVTGGFGGSGMEAPLRGASSVGAKTVGYTLMGFEPNEFCSEVVDSKNSGETLEVQFGIRLGRLLEADGFIIADGGGTGTVVELMAIVNLTTKLWKNPKPVVVVCDGDDISTSPTGKIVDQLRGVGLIPKEVVISFTASPKEAIDFLRKRG